MISEPSRRISSCSRPTALCSRSSERKELEQTSSASAAVLWAAVARTGRISCTTTGTPRAAICQAASDPASPPPMTCTASTRSSVMVKIYAGRRRAATLVGAVPARKWSAMRKRPLGAGAFNLSRALTSAIGVLPGDPRDIRTSDADVGQLAVTELVKLVQAGVVAPPGAKEIEDCDEHGDCSFLASGTRPGRSTRHIDRVPCCVAAEFMLRRRYA